MSVVSDMEIALEMRGLTPGTMEFDRQLRAMKAERCRQVRSQSSCVSCHLRHFCELGVAYLKDERDKAYEEGYKSGLSCGTAGLVLEPPPEDEEDE